MRRPLLILLVLPFLLSRASSQDDGTAASDSSETDAAPDEGERRAPKLPDAWRQLSTADTSVLPAPKERYCHASDRCGDIMIVHGGGGFTMQRLEVILSDAWGFDVRTNSWNAVSSAGDGPPRIYHSVSTVVDTLGSSSSGGGGCTMLVFGGASAESNQDELTDENSLYALELSRSSASAPITGKWDRLRPSGSLPAPRNEHISIAQQGALYVFGGMSGSNKDSVQQYNDIWKYDYNEGGMHGSWESLSVTGDKDHGLPSERFSLAGTIALPSSGSGSSSSGSSSSFAESVDSGSGGINTASSVSEPTMIIFGGSYFDIRPSSATIVMLDDLWSFGLTSHKWTMLSPRGYSMQRTYMSLVVSSNAVFAFGGMSQRSTERGPVHYVYNDVIRFRLDTKTWTRSIDATSSSLEYAQPQVRFGHTSVMMSAENMVVYGGRFNSLYSDVWSLNTSSLEMTKLEPQQDDDFVYGEVIYYILGIFSIIAICSCAFLATVRRHPARRRGGNDIPSVPAPQGSLHNGGASESLISSLPVELYQSDRSRGAGGGSDGTGKGLEMGLLGTNDTPGTPEDVVADNEEECEQCAICFDAYCDNDQLRVLPCLHRFHMGCVDSWLKRNKSCPLCKHEVDKRCDNQSKAFLAKRISAPSQGPAASENSDVDLEAGPGGGLGFEHKEGGTGGSSSGSPPPGTGRRTNSRVAVSPAPQTTGDVSVSEGSAVWTASRHGVTVPSVASPRSYARNNSSETTTTAIE